VRRTSQSSPASRRSPLAIGATFLLLIGGTPLVAQGNDRIATATSFHKEPNGVLLGRLAANAAATFGATRDGWREVTIAGWIPASSLRNDSREGFDVVVTTAGGVPLRTTPSSDAPSRGSAVAGALFNRVESRGGWVLVRRTVWVNEAATRQPDPAAPAVAAEPEPAERPAARGDSGIQAVVGGNSFASEPGGAPIGRLEATRRVEVVERRDGWTRVRVDVWVPDTVMTGALPPAGISGAEVRAEPDRYVGQTVEWRLQVLAVRQADDLRPELPRGSTYVLARGPLPETGFVYLSVTTSEAAMFRALDPLAEVRVRATIRAGRSRFLPTPVLTFIERLD